MKKVEKQIQGWQKGCRELSKRFVKLSHWQLCAAKGKEQETDVLNSLNLALLQLHSHERTEKMTLDFLVRRRMEFKRAYGDAIKMLDVCVDQSLAMAAAPSKNVEENH